MFSFFFSSFSLEPFSAVANYDLFACSFNVFVVYKHNKKWVAGLKTGKHKSSIRVDNLKKNKTT